MTFDENKIAYKLCIYTVCIQYNTYTFSLLCVIIWRFSDLIFLAKSKGVLPTCDATSNTTLNIQEQMYDT